ncbi:retrotransposon protein, putative, ty1-copia subclass [Tanacetum coccineum]|uniref:Retrotransposon protein, putative, ty1-copia subclass n=1 Tax=Tanacetum coccineum TaxID=301880 RepID=A0ABQ5EZS8_9ASTR
MTTSLANNSVFMGFFEEQKLTGPNFIDWYQQLRIVLSIEDKLNYLEQPLPPALVALEGQQVAPQIIAAHTAWIKGSKEIDGQAEHKLLQTTQDFCSCKHEEGQFVSSYVLKMKGYIDNLERLGQPVSLGLAVSLILISLHKEFDGFVLNYNMHSLGKIVNELHAMLNLHEQTLPKNNAPTPHVIQVGKVQKGNNKHKKHQPQMAARGQNQGKGKNKLAYAPKPKIPPPPKREDPTKDLICHDCSKTGHWKRNCRQYLAELLKKKKNAASRELVVQGLRACRKRKSGALILYVGNGQREAVEAIDIFLFMSLEWIRDASGSLEDLEIIEEEDTYPSIDTRLNHEVDDLEIDEPQSDIIPIRSSTRTRRPTNLLDPESDKRLNAMNVEMQSMKDNKVWDLVDLPPNGKTVGIKWLFKKKTDMDGVVHTYKACLMAKGYTQTPGIDYEETFSPVADIRAIRILIAIAAFYDYEIWQMDVKTAFLNGYLSEEVYMEQPEGFVNPKYLNRVCKLKRSIYGLKQASRQWNKRFDDEIKKFGFTQNRDEPCVYLKASGSNVTFLILYVDDILIMGNNIPMLQDVKSYLGRCFAMKDLGEAAYILGIKIYRDRSRRLIGLCQSAYIEKILKRYHMENSKRGSIPMQEKLRLSKSQGALPYRIYGVCIGILACRGLSLVSSPLHAMKGGEQKRGRPLFNPLSGFVFRAGDNDVISKGFCYTDAGYLTDADDLMSQTRYVFILNGCAVDWKSAKQSIFATSSAEAKYIAA